MAPLLAYALTATIVVLFLVVDLVTGGFASRLLFSPFPFLTLPSYPATIGYIVFVYVASSAFFGWSLRASAELAEASKTPKWVEDLQWIVAAIRRDYGRWPLVLVALIAGICLLASP